MLEPFTEALIALLARWGAALDWARGLLGGKTSDGDSEA